MGKAKGRRKVLEKRKGKKKDAKTKTLDKVDESSAESGHNRVPSLNGDSTCSLQSGVYEVSSSFCATDTECSASKASVKILNSMSLDSSIFCSNDRSGSGFNLDPIQTDSNWDSSSSHAKVIECSTTESNAVNLSFVRVDHDYFGSTSISPNGKVPSDNQDSNCDTPILQHVPIKDLLLEVKIKVDTFLSKRWISVFHANALKLLNISPQNNVIVQRSVEFSAWGEANLFVHCQEQCIDPYLKDVFPPIPLESDSVDYFVDRVVSIVNNVRRMEICSGMDEDKYREVWATCPYGEVDKNPYRECRYSNTLRSLNCQMLVPNKRWRCPECTKLGPPLRRRLALSKKENLHPSTNNKFLNENQKMKKLKEQQQEIEKERKKVARLQAKMQDMIEKESVHIEQSMSDAFTEILRENDNVTPAQLIFIQQQVKASQLKNSCAMKWHPTLIRLALAIHLTSPSAYELIRDTGMVKLPSSRTLFEYSHVSQVKEGVDSYVIEKLAEKVEKLSNELHPRTKQKLRHKKYNVLMADEMYISQNLVFQKATGKLIGFTSLDYVDAEIRTFNQHLDDPQKEIEEVVIDKIMVYMVKGVTNGIKEVVACFGSNTTSATQMKFWTWHVIGALERSGIAIIAFVCDGSSVNRAFIKMHKPATPHPSGVVFDTWNKCAREENYFLFQMCRTY